VADPVVPRGRGRPRGPGRWRRRPVTRRRRSASSCRWRTTR
jgi:hypothetical protein